jgi:hypothetical protein
MSVTSVTIPTASAATGYVAAEPGTARRTARTLLVGGTMLAVGALAWAVGGALADPDKMQTAADAWDNVTGGMFQIGAAGLLAVYAATGAIGGRKAKIVLRIESVILALAGAWTIGVIVSPGANDGIMPLLDACWPLSQLGLLVLGIMVAKKGQWTGLLRWLPLAGALWLLVVGIGMGVGGDTGGQVVHTIWFAGVYGTLGALLARDGVAASRSL